MVRAARVLCLLPVAFGLACCSGTRGRIVTPDDLARYEGGGSLLTLWYEGSDADFHYFNRLHKMTTHYRIRREDLVWKNAFPLGSRELATHHSLVRREFSEFIRARDGE
jgi:lipocalin